MRVLRNIRMRLAHQLKDGVMLNNMPDQHVRAKIILLGIISIVCIARTSGKTDSGPQTTMMSWSVLSWARGRLTVTFDLESRLKVTGSSRNVPRFPIVEMWRDRTHSEWFGFNLNKIKTQPEIDCWPWPWPDVHCWSMYRDELSLCKIWRF